MSDTEAEAIAGLVVEAQRKPQTIDIEHDGLEAEVLLVPNDCGGYHQHSVKALLKEYRDAPERRSGTAKLTTLESFVAHTKRFQDEDSQVFMDRSGPRLLCVLDYHRKGSSGAPRFGVHRGEYMFPLSDEWKAWNGHNATPMAQNTFAQWLEDHITEIADPAAAGDGAKAFVELLSCGFASPSKLLEVSRGLELHVGQRVKQHVRLGTGEISMAFEESHSDAGGAALKVPQAFLLALPVFRQGELYQIPTRLRYRVNQGVIAWSFEMHRAPAILDHALNEACQTVAEETGLDVLEGLPE
jgi:uncharacterized protein YfdQ (DUF2303 family)